jgi:hypothetical protein
VSCNANKRRRQVAIQVDVNWTGNSLQEIKRERIWMAEISQQEASFFLFLYRALSTA